jgi:hypothetical protein
MHTLLFLLAGSYPSSLNMEAHVRAVNKAKPLAVCASGLVAEKASLQDDAGKVRITSACNPVAWLAGLPGVKAGKVAVAPRERGGFAWQSANVGVEGKIVDGKQAVITLGSKEIYRTPATAVNCAWSWAGDLNGDRELDLIVDCLLNEGQLPPLQGVFLSGKKGYTLTKQSFMTGSI